jgi:hypothetical protein
MKKLWKFLKEHWKEDFAPQTYVPVALLLITLLIANYSVDFEDTVLDYLSGFEKFASYFLFYAIPYYLTVWIILRKSSGKVWTYRFFAKSLFGLSILSLDSSLPFLQLLLADADPQLFRWLYKVSVNMISLITVLLPLYLCSRLAESKHENFYGLSPHRFDSSPYFQMLLIMLPIIIAATFLPGFLKQYPMYKSTSAHEILGVPEFVTAITYEFAYGLDFVTVELLFRGFLVIGMVELLGRKSVLAMAVVYCLLHFGKPAGEAISSIFGGYILGVIAYETKSIWGGVIVHAGIAWMMELVSFTAKELQTSN